MVAIHVKHSNLIWDEASNCLTDLIRLFHNITQPTLILLSGGSATAIYKPLASFLSTADLDPALAGLAFGQVDERFKPKKVSGIKYQVLGMNKDEINAYRIERTGLWKVCLQRKIPYYTVSQKGTLAEATREYNQIVSKLFKKYIYKIAVLGIGEDGHTAGLLPGYRAKWDKRKFAVGYENDRQFSQRISLAPFALRKLDYALVIAAGPKKRQALKNILDPGNYDKSDKYPGVVVQSIKKVDVFTDFKI